jgi:energy-coupling factor transporter ATP-binding protein EcfA2
MTSPTHITDDGNVRSDYDYRDDGIAVFAREKFCESYFHFNKGEHVLFGGPTQRGKTTLAFQLVRHIATPEYPAYVAVSKPDDTTSISWGQRLGYRRISEFPPTRKVKELDIFDGKPSGYLVWPQFGNIDLDIPNARRVHGKMLKETYADGAKGKACILIMDDTMVKAKVMQLDNEMVTILAMAGAMGISLWIFVQKNTDSGRTTVWGFEQSTHLFIAKGGDHRVLQRYAEIAGDKGHIVMTVVPTLKPYQFLYIHKYEGFCCIVDSQ